MAATQIPITNLDFDTIKEQIKDHYRNNASSPFKDWDFDGSGLNLILDQLAYNATFNAKLAHLAANEGFLSSAQLRKNVVARAKTLGYLPHSVTAPSATIYLTGDDINSLTSIPRKTRFTTSIDGTEYSFLTAETFTATTGTANTTPIKIFQGEFRKVRYTFNSIEKRQKFKIPDKNTDISTRINTSGDKLLTVKTYPHTNTSAVTTYTQFTELSDITATSNVFFITENPDGYYVIEFGDDTLGAKPANGSIVEIEYFTTAGADANDAVTFTLASSLDYAGIEVDNSNTSATIASGGGDRETIEQIRANAPISFTAQDRAVTVDDYKSIVLNNSAAQAVSVWGGEDNVPVTLGTVFISAKKANDVVLSDDEKTTLDGILNDKGVLTLLHSFVDPEFTYLYFTMYVKYNPNLTELTNAGVVSKIKGAIQTFDNANLEDYNSVFRYSQFLQYIDNSDIAFLSTIANVYAYKKVTIGTSASSSYVLDYNFRLDLDAFDGDVVSSEPFSYDGGTYKLGTKAGDGGSIRYLVLKEAEGGAVYQSGGSDVTFGEVNTTTGYVGIGSDSQHSGLALAVAAELKVLVRPRSNDVVARFNDILQLDETYSTVVAEVDTVALSGNAGIKGYTTYDRA